MLAAETAQRPIPGAVATYGQNERVAFLRKTYLHLAGAIAVFIALEYLLLSPGSALYDAITRPLLTAMVTGRASWLLVLGLFMLVSWVADRWARSDTSRGMQYLGLGLYVFAEALIFIPILFIASTYYHGVIPVAGALTITIFAGLTGTVYFTRKDFSFLGGALSIASFAALGLIICAVLFGFQLGTFFAAVMIALAAGYILYYTSRVLGYYGPTQYVAAALALFSSVALLFFYVLRLVMSLRDN
jgi:FtsH-binding integral membrane protein